MFSFRDAEFLRAPDVEDCLFEFPLSCHRKCRIQLALTNEVLQPETHTRQDPQWLSVMDALRGSLHQSRAVVSQCLSAAKQIDAGIRWRSRCTTAMCSVDSECIQAPR